MKRRKTRKKTRCWKGYKPVKGKRPYSKGSCRRVRRNKMRGTKIRVRVSRPSYGKPFYGDIISVYRRTPGKVHDEGVYSSHHGRVDKGYLIQRSPNSGATWYTKEDFRLAKRRGLRRNSIETPERSSWVGLQILTPAQVLKEFYSSRKSISDESEPMLFFRTGTSESTKTIASLARKIGRYNNFNGRKIAPFIEKLGRVHPHIAVILGREYSPVLYLDNIDEELGMRIVRGAKKHFKADEASYDPLRRRVRLWWD